MKRLTSVAVAVSLAIGAASTTWAGQEPYVGVKGADIDMNRYYLEPKLWRWLHTEFTNDEPWGYDTTQDQEAFQFSSPPIVGTYPEVCVKPLSDGLAESNGHLLWEGELEETAWLKAKSPGWYKWRINLPKTPLGMINIQVQCGLLKPNTLTSSIVDAEELDEAMATCAGETGEKAGPNCTRDMPGDFEPNKQVILQALLPTVTAMAYPDISRGLAPFHLTAYRTPSTYANILDKAKTKLVNDSKNLEVLDGSTSSRIVLKACQPESILVKRPVPGQINGLGETEAELYYGEEIEVKLQFPTNHTMDVYCGKYSVKIMGIGEPGTDLNVEDPI
jgi:hypothetical protein